MVAPIVAAKAVQGSVEAAKALTGDIYTRRWQSKPKKKGQAPVEHELKLNAVSAAALALGAGAAVTAAGVGLWLMQRKVTSTAGKTLTRIIDYTDTTYTVYTQRGLPIRRGKRDDGRSRTQRCLTKGEAAHYTWQSTRGLGSKREYVDFHTDKKNTLGTGERQGFGVNLGGGSLVSVGD